MEIKIVFPFLVTSAAYPSCPTFPFDFACLVTSSLATYQAVAASCLAACLVVACLAVASCLASAVTLASVAGLQLASGAEWLSSTF